MNYYSSIKFIPIFNFFEVNESNDLRYLLKLDDYSILPDIGQELSVKLLHVYENISNEYNEYSGEQSYNEIFDNNKSIITLTIKKDRINFIIQILRFKYMPGIQMNAEKWENELRQMGNRLNYSNQREFYSELDRIQHGTKSLDQRIKDKKEENENLKQSNKFNYLDSIVKIEDTLGIKFNIYKDTIYYYLKRKDAFEKKRKAIEKQQMKMSA